MKYADVKAQKKNYLVFSQTVPTGQNFYVALLPDLSFSNFRARHPYIKMARPLSLPSSHSEIFHSLRDIDLLLLSAQLLSCNHLTYIGKNTPRTHEKAGGKFDDILHQYCGFWFRQT